MRNTPYRAPQRRLPSFLFAGSRAAALLLAALGVLALAGCGPLPGDPPHGRTDAEREVVMLRTDHPRYSYLIDTRRGLCFLADTSSGRLTRIYCEELPEALELLGLDPSLPPDPAEYEIDPEEDIPLEEEPAAEAVDDEEIAAFQEAYTEIFCAYRAAGAEAQAPPDEEAVVARHGFTLERYHEIRRALARGAETWRAVSQGAVAACP